MARSGADWLSVCSTVCCATRPTCGAGPRVVGRCRGWRSSTPKPPSASRCGGRVATTRPSGCWGASAWRWWTPMALAGHRRRARVGPGPRRAARTGRGQGRVAQPAARSHGRRLRRRALRRSGRTCAAEPPRRRKRPRPEGFVVLAGCWVTERSFGWLTHWGGLLRDRAGRRDVTAVLASVQALINTVRAGSNRLLAMVLSPGHPITLWPAAVVGGVGFLCPQCRRHTGSGSDLGRVAGSREIGRGEEIGRAAGGQGRGRRHRVWPAWPVFTTGGRRLTGRLAPGPAPGNGGAHFARLGRRASR